MKPVTIALLAVCVAESVWIEPMTAAGACESLSALKLPDTTITIAQSVVAGAFSPPTPPAPGDGGQAYATLPAFCRVAATIKPTRDSDIKVEVWLPASGWNGKYQAVGNWRMGRFDLVWRDGSSAARRVCDQLHRYGTHGRERELRPRPS